MAFVHSNGYVHRDLKPSNILINGQGEALISDFGTICLQSPDYTLTPESGTVHYAAPELYRDGVVCTTKADVFSFGLTLFEMLTGRAVFRPGKLPFPIIRKFRRGKMPLVPDSCGQFMQALIASCWAMDPDSRPSFDEILTQFEGVNFAILPGADPSAIHGYVSAVREWEALSTGSECSSY
jgi:serine/threonine protein kinase